MMILASIHVHQGTFQTHHISTLFLAGFGYVAPRLWAVKNKINLHVHTCMYICFDENEIFPSSATGLIRTKKIFRTKFFYLFSIFFVRIQNVAGM